MYIEKNSSVAQLIPLWRGYSGERFYDPKENYSAFYSVFNDEQGTIPINGMQDLGNNLLKSIH